MLTRHVERVMFDEERQTYFVVRDDGRVLATGFASHEAAWCWIDARDQQAAEARRGVDPTAPFDARAARLP